jgi:hypothetical protein
LKAAQSGDQILMASGDYGSLKIQDIHINGQVTITSADPNAPAVIQYLSVSHCDGLTFTGIEINVRPGSLGIGVGYSSEINFENMHVHGTVDGEYTLDGSGMTVRNSTNVTVSNSTFHDLGGGITHIDDNGLVLSNNSFHDLRSDGIHGTRSSNVTITDNTFTDFHPQGSDHPDAIQFWTNGDAPASNITITGNTITRGDGSKIQGIFLGDEGGAGYKNVTITENAVIGGMYHGIRLVHGDGAVVSDNLVVGYTDMTSWIQIKDSTNFVAQDNQATSFIISNFDLLANGNEFLQQAAIGDLSALVTWQAELEKLAQTTDGSLSSPTDLTDTVVDPIVDTVTDTGADSGTDTTHDAPVVDAGPTDGADSLAGTTGADNLAGGSGDDKYLVNHVGDVVVETNGGGNDTVFSTLSDYSLPLRDAKGMIENIVLVGSGAQSATGNQLDNLIVGSAFDNTLNGGQGDDTLVAGGGHDVINGGPGHDVIVLDGDPNSFAEIHTFAVKYDTLDLSNLLQSYSGNDPVADGWVQFVVNKGGPNAGTHVFVDVDGPNGPGGFVEVANLVLQKTAMVMGTDWIF